MAGGRPVPPEQRAQAREQLVESERLDEVVVGSRVEPGDPVCHGVAGSQEQDRRAVAARPQLRGDGDPVHAWHEHVQDERVGRRHPDPLERVDTVRGELDLVALETQRPLQRGADRELVVDDQDAHRVTVIPI